MEQVLTTGDLARATGETVRTVRFYEEQGILRPATISEGGHRRYDGDALERLQLILDFRELGLSIHDIRTLLAMREGCRTASELRRLEAELRQALRSVSDDDLDPGTTPCPCAVGATQGAPRIVRVLARTGDGDCAGIHAAGASRQQHA
jgi:DNA-binding transcriptional MerR regulator